MLFPRHQDRFSVKNIHTLDELHTPLYATFSTVRKA